MRVLLLSPWARGLLRTNTADLIESQLTRFPPLGLLYLASFLLAQRRHDVQFLDANLERLPPEELGPAVLAARPRVVGIQALSFTLTDAMLAARAVKAADPTIHVTLGGAHPTIYPGETLRLDGVDSIVAGEGEAAFADLADALEDGRDPAGTPGVAVVRAGEVHAAPPRGFEADLDRLPFPARALSPYRKYRSPLSKRSPITSMVTSRGCPHGCLFCNRPHMGRRFRAVGAERVADELTECQRLGIEEVFLFDDCFTEDRARALQIAASLRRRGLRIDWEIRARVDQVDPELLGALARAGCRRIHYGAESGSQRILDYLRKGFQVADIRRAFRETRAAGLEAIAHFIVGCPPETERDFQETVRLAVELRPAFAEFTLLTPFPATDLYRTSMAESPDRGDWWREFAADPQPSFRPPYANRTLSEESLHALQRRAYASFYFRPVYLLRRALRITSLRQALVYCKAGISLVRMRLVGRSRSGPDADGRP